MRPLPFSTLVLLLALLVSVCACQLFQPTLDNIKVGSQIDDKTKEVISPLATFPARTETIYTSVYLKNALSDTKLRATWQWEGHNVGEPTEIDASGSRFVEFNIQRPRDGWRSGSYTVTIEIPDSDQTLSQIFTVK